MTYSGNMDFLNQQVRSYTQGGKNTIFNHPEAGGVSGAASGGKGSNLDAIFKGTTGTYDPNAPVYSNMPQGVNMPAFLPGQQDAIANQLSQAYGAPPSAYNEQMNSLYAPMQTTRLYEPLTQTARAFGMTPTGQPGGWEAAKESGGKKGQPATGGYNPEGYQQWGMDTNSPLLNSIFGLKGRIPTAEEQAWLKAEEAKKAALTGKSLRNYVPPKNPFEVGGY